MDQGQQQDPAQAGGQAQGGQQDDGQMAQAQGQQPVGGGHADPNAGQAQTGGQAQGGQQDDGQVTAAPAAEAEENFLRPRPPDSELGIGVVGDFATSVAIPAHPDTTFDEAYFLKMLAGSISLTKNEKKKIVESISKLSQFQIDELIKIFEEERRKFAELDEKHQVKIRELQAKQMEDWKDLEMSEQQEGKQEEDAAAAEALKAQLLGSTPEAAPAPEANQDQEPPAQAA